MRLSDRTRLLILLILIFPFIQQRNMSEFPGWLYNLYTQGIVISSTVIYIYIVPNRKFLEDAIVSNFPVICFFLCYVFTTLMRSPNNIVNVIGVAYYMTAIMLLISYEFLRDPGLILKAMALVYGMFIFLNWILDIIYPQGLYKIKSGLNHSALLLGDDNAISYVILPGLIVLIVYSLYRYNRITILIRFLMAISCYTLVKKWAVSGMISVLLFVFGVIYVAYGRKVNPRILFMIFIIGLCIIYGGLVGENGFISRFIVNVLHKDISLTGRTVLWEKAFLMIKKHILLGYGGYFKYGSFKLGGYYYPVHTTFLQIIIDGGLLLFLSFWAMVWHAYNRLYYQKESVISNVLSLGMICMFINYITEYAYLIHTVVIISIMININKLTSGKAYEHRKKYKIRRNS